jgi:hypothetical protein
MTKGWRCLNWYTYIYIDDIIEQGDTVPSRCKPPVHSLFEEGLARTGKQYLQPSTYKPAFGRVA